MHVFRLTFTYSTMEGLRIKRRTLKHFRRRGQGIITIVPNLIGKKAKKY